MTSYIEWLKSMQGMLGIFGLVSFVALGVCLYALMRAVRKALPPAVGAKRVLTDNEREFLGRLRQALPEYDIWPQVAMGALIQTTLPEQHPQYWQVRRKFAQKIVDYVVRGRQPERVVAVIELDDRTHDPKRDAERDALLASAGIRTIRFDARAKPLKDEIRQRVLACEFKRARTG